MSWIVYIIGAAGLYAFIVSRRNDANPAVGALAYLLLIAFSIAGVFWLTDGKGVESGEYSECGSGPFKYDC